MLLAGLSLVSGVAIAQRAVPDTGGVRGLRGIDFPVLNLNGEEAREFFAVGRHHETHCGVRRVGQCAGTAQSVVQRPLPVGLELDNVP